MRNNSSTLTAKFNTIKLSLSVDNILVIDSVKYHLIIFTNKLIYHR